MDGGRTSRNMNKFPKKGTGFGCLMPCRERNENGLTEYLEDRTEWGRVTVFVCSVTVGRTVVKQEVELTIFVLRFQRQRTKTQVKNQISMSAE